MDTHERHSTCIPPRWHRRRGGPTPHGCGVVVSTHQSERLLTLLVRLGFTAERIGDSRLRVESSSIDEVRRFATFFHIDLRDAPQAHPPE